MFSRTSQTESSQKKETTAHIIVQNFADSVVLGFLVIPVYSIVTPFTVMKLVLSMCAA